MKFPYWYVKDFLNIKQIKKINKYILKNGESFNLKADTIKTSTCKSILLENLPELKKLSPLIHVINKKAFGFDIYPHYDHLFILNLYDSKNKAEYKFHTDGEKCESNFTIKLTCIINLSDTKYEGGELILFPYAKEIIVKEFEDPGSLIVFPSFILHKVNPVNKGIRKSGVLFTHGRWWK